MSRDELELERWCASALKQTVAEIEQAQANAHAQKSDDERAGLMPDFLASLASVIELPDEDEEGEPATPRDEDISNALRMYGHASHFTFND